MPTLRHQLLQFLVLPICCLAIFFVSCSGNNEASGEKAEADSLVVDAPAVNEDSVINELSRDVLALLKEKDYTGLAPFVHPEAGVRFSPYGFIDTLHDRVFTREQLVQLAGSKDSARIHWGSYDGSGDSIYLTLPAYINKFVYDADFLRPGKVALDSVIGLGNSLNNLSAVYPNARFTESHFSGFDKKYSGMDWRSLRLVFQKKGNHFYLVGIVHDQWTS